MLDNKLKALFGDVETSVQKEVNAAFEAARINADERLYKLGYDAACREHNVGKYEPKQ